MSPIVSRRHAVVRFGLAGLGLFALLAGCARSAESAPKGTEALPAEAPAGLAIATFAGGCFWCMEAPFDKLEGVVSTTSGYTAGPEAHPTYKQVSAGKTGHTEALRVVYDPAKVSFERLLEVFWHNIDPTQANGQFCDLGKQYRTGIYVHDGAQEAAALASRKALEASGRLPGKVVTEIEWAGAFYAAEDYHQDFYQKNPAHYYRYRAGCGRDARLQVLWGAEAGR